MRPKLNLFILCCTFISQTTCQNLRIITVSLGETISLPCNNSSGTSSIWKRENEVLSEGFDVNPSVHSSDRYKIIGDFSYGEYHLQITNVSKFDLVEYMCEVQINNKAVQKRIILKLKATSTAAMTSSAETTPRNKKSISTTEDDIGLVVSSSKGHDIRTNTSKTETQEVTTEESISVTTQEFVVTSEETTVVTENESFLSELFKNDKFVFGSIIGGFFTLFLILSISCNIYINRKCKSGNMELMIEPPNEGLQKADDSSTYESIRDSNLSALINNLATNEKTHKSSTSSDEKSDNVSATEKPYLEIIDERILSYTNPYQAISEDRQDSNYHKYLSVGNVPRLQAIASAEYEENTSEAHPDYLDVIPGLAESAGISTPPNSRRSSTDESDQLSTKSSEKENSHRPDGQNDEDIPTYSKVNKNQKILNINITSREPTEHEHPISLEESNFSPNSVDGQNENQSKTKKMKEKSPTSFDLKETIHSETENDAEFNKAQNDEDCFEHGAKEEVKLSLSSLNNKEFDSSSDDNNDIMSKHESFKDDDDHYQDLHKNNFDDAHQYEPCSNPLSWNIL